MHAGERWGEEKLWTGTAAASKTEAGQRKASSTVGCEKSIQFLLLIAGKLLLDLANQIILLCCYLCFGRMKRNGGVSDVHRDG